jgi:hypothetical protein
MKGAYLTGIEDLSGFEGVNLPENYVSRILPVLQGQAVGNVAVIQSGQGETSEKIDISVLNDPETFRKGPFAEGTTWLGPLTENPDPLNIPLPTSTSQPASLALRTSARPSVLCIIDVGIAFWNERFHDGTHSVFSDVGYLDLTTDTSPWLGSAEIARLISIGDHTSRDTLVRDELAQGFPQSIYAAKEQGHHILTPASFGHGTAMADLALRNKPVPTYALELPGDVLLDSSGDLLEASLIQAIRTLRARIDSDPDITANYDVHVLLAFGYPGGPQDGSRAITQLLNHELTLAGMNLIVPAGNHLQDQCHAQWQSLESGNAPLALFLPEEDYSATQLSIHYKGPRPDFTLRDPSGHALTWLSSNTRIILMKDADGLIIGVACEFPNADGGEIRIALSPTAGDGITVKAGRWHIQLTEAYKNGDLTYDAMAWILRDDLSIPGAVARPRRQAWFDDDAYEVYGSHGAYAQTDTAACRVKRAGTASALTAGTSPRIHSVAATQMQSTGPVNADYSGRPITGVIPNTALVHTEIGSAGVLALGNGGATKFRVSGTSAAAAIYVNTLLV